MRAFTLFLLLVVLTGCANTKRDRYTTPVVPLPNQYKLAAPAPAAMESRKGGGESKTKPEALAEAQLAEWWRMLGSPELNALVDRALANNADLRIATLRIVQAKARADQASADQRPVVTAPYQAKIEGPEFGIGSLVPGETIDRTRRTYQLSLRADWRADLWGERSSATESADMQLWRATFQRDDTRRLLIANTAATYIEYLSFNDRVRVARETEAVLRDMLESVRARMEAGDATITDLEQQRAAVYAVQATIPALELQRENAANSLAQLLGVTPTALSLTDSGLEALTFPGVLPGVPANLLRQRPDVRVVEARLLAADADIDVAYARLLPPLDLTAQAGAGGYVLSRLFQNHTHFWTLIANLAATIFDSGKRDNEVAFARAMHEELVETYVRVLYNAIREAEDAIASVQMNSRRQDAQQAAADAARRAWEYSIESYGAGAIDYLTLLDTERTYHRNLDEFHRIRMERHKGLVALFNALGGGIPRSATLADEGAPSAATGTGGSADAAAPAGKSYLPVPEDGQEYWLVEIAGLQDRAGIAHLWRDLNQRFPELMAGRSVVPRLLGRVSFEEQERAAWYRVLVAHFPTLDAAELFCGQLGAQLQRCRVVSSRTEAFQDLLTRTRPELKAPTLETAPDLADASQRTTPPRLSADDPGQETGAAPAQSMPTVIEHMPEIEKPQQPSTRPSLPPTSGSAAAVYDNRSRGFVLKADIPKSSDLRHCLGLDSNDAVSRCISQLP
ncbi:MAG: efflux transporter outer membrane subunit [Rhodocyclaceae bacterium]|nr:efflux transporter outer membrane subunit [Rhodocyclaceae bacterium]